MVVFNSKYQLFQLPLFLFFALLIFNLPLLAQEKEAGESEEQRRQKIEQRDFQFQGEYSGTMGTGDESRKVGMQVIAIGDGQFKIVAFVGGLPGDGWDGEDHEPIDVVGKYDEDSNSVAFVGYARGDAHIADGVMTIKTAASESFGTLERVVRESETLGAEPPEGAVVLFDGSSVENWQPGEMTEDGLLKQGAMSTQKFKDHSIHIEFQLPFMPNAKGQGRGNSGIYVQGRYEVQMLDSFGLEGRNNECGGIYSVKDPDLNMCYPPMSWQTYDIDFRAARYNDERTEMIERPRMTVRHNGVVIHDDVELPGKKTTAAPTNPGPSPGPVFLQNHGNQVRYRNIWVMENKE